MDKVREKSTALISTTLYDENDVVIPVTSITAFTATLHEKESATVINSRTAVNLYGAGTWAAVSGMKATVSSVGVCTIRLATLDNAIVGKNTDGEIHVLTCTITTGATLPVTINQEIEYMVEGLTKIT